MNTELLKEIEDKAKELYPYKFSGPDDRYNHSIDIYNLSQQRGVQAFITGATLYASRGEKLREALEFIKKMTNNVAIRVKITEALATYSSKQ